MTTDLFTQLFDRMDSWRHLPNYQLERRADLFFSLYLEPVLKAKLRFEISPIVIPEFPVRIGTIYPNIPIDKSYKIDYVCFSSNMDTAIFVELKTESSSRRESQDKYLAAASKVGFSNLLIGLLQIFHATASKRKYYHLLKMLEQAGFLQIPPDVHSIIKRKSLLGINAVAEKITIACSPTNSMVLYIQPNGQGRDIISFSEFKAVVETFHDPISERFAQSLDEWATIKPGHRFQAPEDP